MDIFAVEAYTASWIEIGRRRPRNTTCRVEAYTASWIEIPLQEQEYDEFASKPIRLRGLKYCGRNAIL